MKKCKKCGDEFEPRKGLISYCSLSCRNTRVHSEETKKKISDTNSGKYFGTYALPKKCKYCEKVLVDYLRKANTCNGCKPYVLNIKLFEKLNIHETDLGKANILACDKLIDLYYSNNKSLSEIYEEYNIRGNTIYYFLKKNGIPLRTVRDGVRLAIASGKIITPVNKQYKSGIHTTWFNKDIFMRSSYEFRFATHLDKQKVFYQYEKQFEYYFDDLYRTYRADFFIPDWNLVVETKSRYYYEKDKKKIGIQRQAVLDSGYEFVLLLDEDEIDNFNK
jgi:hypothetical protein